MNNTPDRVKVDHTPGGSPETKAAPAPKRTVATFSTFRRMTAASPLDGRNAVKVDDLPKIAYAAARAMLRGAMYSTEDRLDASSDAMLRALSDFRTASGLQTLSTVRAVPADFASFSRMANYCANYRRKLDSERERDLADAEHRSTESITASFLSRLPASVDDPALVGTAYGARVAALTLLEDSGLWEGSRRLEATAMAVNAEPMAYPQGVLFPDERRDRSTVRAVAPRGPLWTLAYSVARSAGGAEATEIATELELSDAAYRKQLSRALSDLRKSGHDTEAWMRALTLNRSTGKGGAASLPESERTRPGDATPNVRTHRSHSPGREQYSGAYATPVMPESSVTARKLPGGRRKRWDGKRSADWTRELSVLNRARFHKLAELRESRRDAV